MKKRFTLALLGCLALFLITSMVMASPARQGSPHYALPWDVVAGGGGVMASSSYTIQGTIGQPAIGPASSTRYTLQSGYWYGLAEREFRIFLPVNVTGSGP